MVVIFASTYRRILIDQERPMRGRREVSPVETAAHSIYFEMFAGLVDRRTQAQDESRDLAEHVGRYSRQPKHVSMFRPSTLGLVPVPGPCFHDTDDAVVLGPDTCEFCRCGFPWRLVHAAYEALEHARLFVRYKAAWFGAVRFGGCSTARFH